MVQLLTNRLGSYIDPLLYLKACGEILALLFAVSWVVSVVFSPAEIASNPLNARLGYYSLCVGFDHSPANRIALAVYIPTAYFGIRYVWTDTQRAELERSRLSAAQYWFTVCSNGLYALSLSIFGLVFLENPFINVYGHTGLFVQLILLRFVVVAANFYEAPEVSEGSKVFLGVYGVISLVTPVLFLVSFLSYDKTGEHLLPWQITAAFDYGWFICLVLTTKYLPSCPRIKVDYQLEQT